MGMEVALQYNDGYQETLFTYANNIKTTEGGTHLAGLRAALTRTINTYATRNNLLKKCQICHCRRGCPRGTYGSNQR